MARSCKILQIRGFLRNLLTKKSRKIQGSYREFQEFLHWVKINTLCKVYFSLFISFSKTLDIKISVKTLRILAKKFEKSQDSDQEFPYGYKISLCQKVETLFTENVHQQNYLFLEVLDFTFLHTYDFLNKELKSCEESLYSGYVS